MAQLVAHHTGSVGVTGSNPVSSTPQLHIHGAMAQLVAHHTGSVGVTGSNPVSSTKTQTARLFGRAVFRFGGGAALLGGLAHAFEVCVAVSAGVAGV